MTRRSWPRHSVRFHVAAPPAALYYYHGFPGTVLVAAIGFLGFSLWLVLLGSGLPSPPRTPSRSRPARRNWRRQAIRALVLVVGVAVISVTVFASYAIAGYEAVLPPGTVPWGLVIGYTVARLLLAARGKLPWRLQAFLADAHRLGMLRRIGPGYQFRHARLQQHLATHPGLPDPRTPQRPDRPSPAPVTIM
ncbi:hypothetical protein [Streptomyces triculaminicus]|uniref:hypothetical protein n=1 Tax=Streptomyces triculaminicus TaxID=2816232 RepID=UPI0037D2FB77